MADPRALLIPVLAVALSALVGPSAIADPNTGRLRTLDCGQYGSVVVELGPAEFITTTNAALHFIGSTTVLIPYRVEVSLSDGMTLLTLDKKLPSGQLVVTCTYVDPADLAIEVTGTVNRSQRQPL